jgi:hypothetical protein
MYRVAVAIFMAFQNVVPDGGTILFLAEWFSTVLTFPNILKQFCLKRQNYFVKALLYWKYTHYKLSIDSAPTEPRCQGDAITPCAEPFTVRLGTGTSPRPSSPIGSQSLNEVTR